MRSITRIVLWGCFLFAQNTSDTVLGKDEFTIRVTDAETTLNNLAKDNLERQKKDDYYRVHIALGNSNRIPTEMTVSERTAVDTVAASETEISYNAKALLHFWFDEDYPVDWTMFGAGSNKMAGISNVEQPGEMPEVILLDKESKISKIYPNPANDKLMMDYQIKENEEGWLKIYDVIGQLIVKERLLHGNNRLEINAERLNNGVYFYETLIDGKPVLTDKLLIIKQ